MNTSENCAKQYQRVFESNVYRNINKLYPFLDFVCKVKMTPDDKIRFIMTCMSRKRQIGKLLCPEQLDNTTSKQFDALLAEYFSAMIAKLTKDLLLREE